MRAELLIALYPAPPSPSWSNLLGNWSLDPLFGLTVVAAVLYATGVRRLADRGRRWPRARSWCFAAGLVVVLIATQSGVARYDRMPAGGCGPGDVGLRLQPPPAPTSGPGCGDGPVERSSDGISGDLGSARYPLYRAG